MNRASRIKSQLGKSRTVSGRRRNANRYHQLLITEFLDERGRFRSTEAPACEVHPDCGATGEGPSRPAKVRVIEPASSTWEPLSGKNRPIIPFRTPGANPAIAGTTAGVPSPKPSFRWDALIIGFLLSVIPGLGLLLLISLLAG